MVGMKMILLGEFHSILYDEEPLNPQEYLNGINRATLLMVASSMLGYSPSTSKYNNWKELVSMWFRKENIYFKSKVWQRCEKLERDNKCEISLLSPVASLRFFEFVFSMSESVIEQDEILSEVNLFKAYLIFLSNSTNDEDLSKVYLERLDKKIRMPATMLNLTYPVSDFSNYDIGNIFSTQIIKAYFLFVFLESQCQSQTLLTSFCEHFHFQHWKEYFRCIFPLLQAHVYHKSEGWVELNVNNDENYEKNCHFLEALALKYFDIELDSDFKLLRGNPIYKIKEGKYSIISPLFVFEKIYKGLYFKLKEIHNSQLKPQKQLIKDFRSFYTSNFSENILLYKILNHIYSKRQYKIFSGKELADSGYDGRPDYYIRNGNYLFLFENKDVFINADIKQSYNFQILEEEFKKKFYFEEKDGKINNKAILQLASNVRYSLLNENKFDKIEKLSSLKIYPILVLHDSSFNAAGFNHLLNYWFDMELMKLKEEGINVEKVKPLTVINIDTLILYADFLKNKKMSLNDLIDSFIKASYFNENCKYKSAEHLKKSYNNTLLPFSFFLDSFTNVGFKRVNNELQEYVMNNMIN